MRVKFILLHFVILWFPFIVTQRLPLRIPLVCAYVWVHLPKITFYHPCMARPVKRRSRNGVSQIRQVPVGRRASNTMTVGGGSVYVALHYPRFQKPRHARCSTRVRVVESPAVFSKIVTAHQKLKHTYEILFCFLFEMFSANLIHAEMGFVKANCYEDGWVIFCDRFFVFKSLQFLCKYG